MTLVNKVRRKISALSGTLHRQISYAQCGEDLIIDYALRWLGIQSPTYLDIGAHHPLYLSNTYLMYRRKCYGVCVEPDPILWKEIARVRPRDVCLNVGVGVTEQTSADFFIMSASTLNTFSREEAERVSRETSYKIVRTCKLPLISVNAIIEKHFSSSPTVISLDIEGMDLEILKSLEWNRWRPVIFCVETVEFSERRADANKSTDVIDFMRDQGYMVYADTYLNTIFIDQTIWNSESVTGSSR